jgi:hypothetical protein
LNNGNKVSEMSMEQIGIYFSGKITTNWKDVEEMSSFVW